MSQSNNSIISIEMHYTDVIRTVLTNIIKMLTERTLIKKENTEKLIKSVTDTLSDDNRYKIKLDNVPDGMGSELMIQLFPYAVTGVNKSSAVFDFLNKYQKNMSIVVVKSISKRAFDDIINKFCFKNTEVFLQHELMINIIEYDFVPKHALLTDKEREEFYQQYNIKNKNMLKINASGPVSKYFNAKPGDIFRVTRPSTTSGYYNVYRLVINQ